MPPFTKLLSPLVWAQLRPDEKEDTQGQLIARAIVASSEVCPDATFEGQGYWDGKSWPLGTRWVGSAGAFPIKVCEITYPGYLGAIIGSVRLEPRPVDPKTIVVIGDTGCRLSPKRIQNCNSSSEWPFRLVADTVRIHKPDLIIHVGDYYYREVPCPPASTGCVDSPYGDNWETWLKDFFEPAASLLARAPWIMVRGNHEGQTRAGPGFQLLLSQWPRAGIEEPWADDAAPYELRFKELTMEILDVANSDGGDDDKRLNPRRNTCMSWVEKIKPRGLPQTRTGCCSISPCGSMSVAKAGSCTRPVPRLLREFAIPTRLTTSAQHSSRRRIPHRFR
jgi:Calcineurin-like phosphoesterase